MTFHAGRCHGGHGDGRTSLAGPRRSIGRTCPMILSASSVDESASEQGDSSDDEPLFQSEEEITSDQGDSSDADRVSPRPERGYVAGEVSHCILVYSLRFWRRVCVITQKFRRIIVLPELENLGCHDPVFG